MRLFPSYIMYAVRWRRWPSQLQRMHMKGDPTGEVRRISDDIVSQLREEDGGR